MIWRTNHNVPEVYPAESRDFQLLGRLLDIIVNGAKFNVDTMMNISATNIMSSLLPLLQNKVGFFSDCKFSDVELRYILDTFPTIIKNKGSRKGILEAVNVFLRLYCLDNYTSSASAEIGNNTTADAFDKYTIYIYIESTPKDTKALDEMLKYILPTGYTVEYIFYDKINSNTNDVFNFNEEVYINTTNNLINNIRPIEVEPEKGSKKDALLGTVGLVEVNNDSFTTLLEAKKNEQKNSSKKKKITSK